ncbi:Metal-dependent hydrolase, beta-lactamase superfamily II [Evansella caseinilytica]|uniref:Metal-dependent hydrolase, beta-lactamase superfamily II n=1 Tax=Evansella caseinilytica TaxID=1503961 RepID=A0A1H3NMH7_9BACI|nr:MBL fold metallo-hydrolase [Evansella caseinilytica]SDY89625.1 Metal-dependent hydrolase, beta-lactamase superfamily II [Evansella caseinilytica]
MSLRLLSTIFFMSTLFVLGGCELADLPPGDKTDDAAATEDREVDPAAGGQKSPLGAGDLLTVHYIDVGQGDATLLQTKDTAVLIDGGRHDQNEVVPYLLDQGIEEIDLLIGTHPHSDHIGQFVPIIETFSVKEVWMSGGETASSTFENTLDAILAADAEYYEPRAGEVFQIGSLSIEVLHPRELSGDLNHDSISTRIMFGETVFLFTGDAEQEAEREMLATGLELKSHIYKAGHHGSSTSSSERFIERVSPEIVIISAGANNSYGHPHQEVINMFATTGTPIYGTYSQGTVIVTTDGADYEVRVLGNNDTEGEGREARPLTDDTNDMNITSRGCIDLNHASLEELKEIVHIGEARARELQEMRPVAAIDELVNINGINQERLSDMKEQGRICEP